MVKIRNEDTGDPIVELKKVLKLKEVENYQIRRTQTAVIINTKTREEQKQLLTKLENTEKVIAKDGTRTQSPMILITGVQKEKTEEELLTNVRQENEDLEELYVERIKTDLGARNCKIIYK